MFTPPPSPLPHPCDPFDVNASTPVSSSGSSSADSLSPTAFLSPSPVSMERPFALRNPPAHHVRKSTLQGDIQARKHRIGRRTGLSVLLVPLVLALIALSTRYVAHPAAFDFITGTSPDLVPDWTDWHDPGVHEHVRRQAVATLSDSATVGSSIVFPSTTSASASASASTSATTTTTTGVPTIPTSTPVLPTPFPQPFDTTLTQNFSSSCETFMNNMTQTLPFRQCRAFSFLSQSSTEFIEQAQTNTTQLNVDVWGTCNTPLSEDQCTANMAWFATALQKECAQDLTSRNAIVEQSLQSLQTYDLLRQAACLADAGTGAYCYVEAAASSSPADLYLYSLPFGDAFPSDAKPSCSTCAKSVLALFGAQASSVDGLRKTFNNAAEAANKQCGVNYVTLASGLPDTASSGALRVCAPWAALALTVAATYAL